MGSQRQQRVAKQLQQSISTIVEVELSDPRLQLVTFTEVRITPDLLAWGLGFALLMGLVGGLPPAIRAARANVAVALRAL